MKSSNLSFYQKERLKVLEPNLKSAISERNYEEARAIMKKLEDLLKPTGHLTRFMQSENRFLELALELNELYTATTGFERIRKKASEYTRLYLEATALLAICYLRTEDIERAKPLIKEVLTNDKVIKTERTRALFRVEILERFNQEATLFSLKNKKTEEFTEEELETEIMQLLINNKSEDELYLSLGQVVPNQTKNLLFQVHQYSTNQLPYNEKIALPSPEEKIKEKEVGKTVFQSVKRVIYNSLCDPKSEIYKAWFTNGAASLVLSKGYIRTAIISSLANIGVSIKMLIAYIVTLVMKFGLEIYCEHYKPKDLMELRGK